MLAENPTFRSFVDAAFNQIRQAGRHHAAVSIRLLESITTVAGRARTAEERDALRRQAKMIERSSRDGLPEPEDRRDVRERFEAAMRALDGERTG